MMLKTVSPRTMDRSYKSAIAVLRSRRRPARPSADPGNFPSLSRIPDAHGKPSVKGTPSIIGMKEWLLQIGHSAADIEKLNIIHVAGTKGKGSTCAFAESLLSAYGRRTGFPRKTGLYTSPHLIFHEERIRIDRRPIARDLFAKYFFEVWESLQERNDGNVQQQQQPLPRYLQLLALVAFHAFIREGVEAAVFETHHGGEYDATNVIENPVATVITPLGMDHAQQLGPTIENIAWHKSGIFKQGAQAFSAVQDEAPSAILRTRAAEKEVGIEFIGDDPTLPRDAPKLKPDIQRMNCSLALAAARCIVEKKAAVGLGPILPTDVEKGIELFSWPGRFQILSEVACQWFLDGAHNEMSVAKTAEWFIEMTRRASTDATRVLIFNQISNERDGALVLERLADSLKQCHIQHVLFTEYDPHQEFLSGTITTSQSGTPEPMSKNFEKIWRQHQKDSRVVFEPNIQAALETVRRIDIPSGGIHILITGSLHLVGGALFCLDQSSSALSNK